MKNPKIGVVSLGCPKNTTDTEVMLGMLNKAGFQVTFDNDEATICLVNTCSFIEDARRESVATLVELANQGKELIIAGCLAQHFKEELLKELPEARALIGTGNIHKIVEVVEAITSSQKARPVEVSNSIDTDWHNVRPRLQTNMGAYSYLKIAEGCNHKCTFCIIPRLRGPFRSRTIESLVCEAQELVENGVREIILVSQDSTYYGLDIYNRMALPELLEALHSIEGLNWIRIMYFYPSQTSTHLLKTIATLPKVVKYIDIPLQHSHPDILLAMGRPLDPDKTIEQVRTLIDDVAIRTTFITGFPGETEQHFKHLLNFVGNQRLNRLGVFAYSREQEMPSGQRKDQIPQPVKDARRQSLLEAQHEISLELNQALIGQEIMVLVEGFDEAKGHYFGRSQWDAPDIDNLVYIYPHATANIALGDFLPVKVIAAKPYDLLASPLPELHNSEQTQ
ncbi:MAG: 30S ribosomal protein S12 methylthiotransferase RimO [Candidatus Melainabacteria bacterium]|nr:30S ribosomal protein S12 methylthiotransferase RimO [Candidatus Melainabacteria bacterium]